MGCLGEGLVAKGLQYYEMSTILAYMCMEYVCVCVQGRDQYRQDGSSLKVAQEEGQHRDNGYP